MISFFSFVDHFTSEFARYLAASRLTGREIVEIYRHFGSQTQNDDFIGKFIPSKMAASLLFKHIFFHGCSAIYMSGMDYFTSTQKSLPRDRSISTNLRSN